MSPNKKRASVDQQEVKVKKVKGIENTPPVKKFQDGTPSKKAVKRKSELNVSGPIDSQKKGNPGTPQTSPGKLSKNQKRKLKKLQASIDSGENNTELVNKKKAGTHNKPQSKAILQQKKKFQNEGSDDDDDDDEEEEEDSEATDDENDNKESEQVGEDEDDSEEGDDDDNDEEEENDDEDEEADSDDDEGEDLIPSRGPPAFPKGKKKGKKESNAESENFIPLEQNKDSSDESEDEETSPPPAKKNKFQKKEFSARPVQNYDEENKLFVNRLPRTITEEQLTKLFEKCGKLKNVSLPIHKDTGNAKSFAFIQYFDEEGVNNALNEYNNSELDGQTINVRKYEASKPNDKGGQFNRRGRGGFDGNRFGGGNRGRGRGFNNRGGNRGRGSFSNGRGRGHGGRGGFNRGRGGFNSGSGKNFNKSDD